MSKVEHTMYDPFLGGWVPFDFDKAAKISLLTGELITRYKPMTREQIIEKFGDSLTEEQLKILNGNQS